MLECQKIEIKTIPHRHIASDITNFTSAVCAVVTQMSSVGEPVFTSWANTYSADLYSSYTTVLNFSSSWISPSDTFVYNNSANILQVNTVVNNTTGNWNSVYNSYNSSSASFLTNGSADIRYVNISGDIMTGGLSSPSLSTNNLYVAGSTINFFDGTGNVIETLKSSDVGNFKSNYTLTNSRSGKWEEVYSNFSSQSANNNSVYNTVQSNSSTNWNYQGTDLKSLTSNWQNTYNTVSSYSATWVNDAPQTLTFNNINAELTISGGNTVSLSSLSGGGNGSVGVSYLSALSDVSIPSPVNGQVLTYNSITNKWNAGTPLSASGAIGYYGSFYDTTAQTLTSTTQAKRINIAQTYEHNGVSIDNNRIVFNYDGVYELIYSIQYKNTSNAQEDIYIWLKQNGVDIPNSSSVFTINARKSASIPAQMIAVSPFMSTLTAGDFIELYWHCNSTAVTVETFTTHANPTIPDTPGVIVTVKQVTNVQIVPTVGAYLPLSGGTLTGAVSTTNVLYTTGGNSNQWNSVYNNVNSNSAINWNYQGTDIKALTGNWGASGSGNELQFRTNAGAFGAVTNSSVSGGAIILGNEEALSATSVGYLTLRNTTSAVAGTQQVSPSLVFEGQGWKTTATAASQTVRFRQNVLPVQGTANPSVTWKLQSEINNSNTWTDRLTVDSSGVLTLPSSTPTIQNTTGQQLRHGGTGWEIINSNAVTFRVDYNSISMAASLALGWGSTASASFGGNDTMLFRDAAGVIAQRNGLLPQTSRLYNTYTSATTGENLQMQWASNEARIGTSVGSGGGIQRPLVFGSWNSSGTWSPAINIATTGTVSVNGAINANNGILSSSQPVLNTTQTWSNSAVAFTGSVLNIVNTSSSSSSVIQEWQVNGVRSLAILGSDGFGRISGSTINSGFSFNGQSANRMAIWAGGSMLCYLSPTDFGLRGNAAIRWDSTGGDPNSTGNGLSIMRDNQNHILGQRASAHPQTSNIYNTYTNASNYERGFSRWRGSQFTATISGTTMTLTVASVGTFAVGQRIAGTGVTSGTLINSLASGTLGAVGSTYTLSISQTVATATIMNSYSDVYEIGTESLGTGSARALTFFTNGVERINIGATGNITTTNTLSTTNVIYASGGNSDQWNSTYTTVQAISAVEDANTIIGLSLFL